MKRSLLIHNPDGSTSELELNKPIIKIGRATDNDLVLLDSRNVSRSHAAITCGPYGAVSIADLNSSCGTLVNGKPISSSVELTTGDSVRIGDFQLTLRGDPEEDKRFKVEAGKVGLEVLQKHSTLLPLHDVGDRKNLELLYEVGVKLAGSHSTEAVAEAAVELLFKIDEVHRAAVIRWDDERGAFDDLRLKTRKGMGSWFSSHDPADVVMSRTILNRVRQENVPLLIRDAKSQAVDPRSSIIRDGIQAALCSPLSFQGQFLGILYADNLWGPDAFSETDFRTFANIASQTGLALSSAITRGDLLKLDLKAQIVAKSLELAREIQMGLVPKEFPALPDFREVDIFATLVPALEVGGDLYDFFALDKDRICFIIGDVSDKGIPAALFMAMTRTAFKISAMSSPESIAVTMGRVNDFLCESNPQQMFVTAFAGILDLRTGRVDYADAGHEPPFVLHPDGSVEAVSKVGGVVLGFLPGREFRGGTLQFSAGDALFLYTDGVTEAMNTQNQPFGAEAIQTSLSRVGNNSDSEKIVRRVLDDLHGYVGEARQSDDIAMLVIRYFGRDRS